MTSRSSRSNPMLVQNISDARDIVCNMQRLELYVTAHDPPAHRQPRAAEMLTQPDLGLDQQNNKIERSVEAAEEIPSRYKLHSTYERAQSLQGHSNNKKLWNRAPNKH